MIFTLSITQLLETIKVHMSDFKNLTLNNQLCFALYSATHAITRAYREHLSKIGLTYPQYLVMLALWEHQNQTVKSMAELLNLDSPTLTPLLKRLETAGMLNRTRSKQDERIVIISLTPAGAALKDSVSKVQQKVSCETGLTEQEYIELRGKLHHLLTSMGVSDEKHAG